MKIFIYNTKNITFHSRNKNIRKADDIQRKVRQTFPMSSPTYINEFYKTTRLDEKNQPVNEKARKILCNIDAKLSETRNILKDLEAKRTNTNSNQKEIPYINRLNGIKLMKVGNCKEFAIATLAALAANGYYDSKRVCLTLKTEYYDKKTKEKLYENKDSLDHSFVITTLGQENSTESDKIVIDSWLGFTDSISGAKARYKTIFNTDNKNIQNILSYHRSMFRLQMYEKTGKIIVPEDYDCRINFTFAETDEYTPEDIENFGLYVKKDSKIYHKI